MQTRKLESFIQWRHLDQIVQKITINVKITRKYKQTLFINSIQMKLQQQQTIPKNICHILIPPFLLSDPLTKYINNCQNSKFPIIQRCLCLAFLFRVNDTLPYSKCEGVKPVTKSKNRWKYLFYVIQGMSTATTKKVAHMVVPAAAPKPNMKGLFSALPSASSLSRQRICKPTLNRIILAARTRGWWCVPARPNEYGINSNRVV